jgi:hypothetical protein
MLTRRKRREDEGVALVCWEMGKRPTRSAQTGAYAEVEYRERKGDGYRALLQDQFGLALDLETYDVSILANTPTKQKLTSKITQYSGYQIMIDLCPPRF